MPLDPRDERPEPTGRGDDPLGERHGEVHPSGDTLGERGSLSDPEPEPGVSDEPARPRINVVSERGGAQDDEYRWHTGLNRPTGVPDAVEFIDVH